MDVIFDSPEEKDDAGFMPLCVEAAISEGMCWFVADDAGDKHGDYIVTWMNVFNDVVASKITHKDLRLYDKRLPAVIDALISHPHLTDQEQGSILRDTVHHWHRSPPVLYTSERGNHYMNRIETVKPYSNESTLRVTACVYAVEKTAAGVEYLPYGTRQDIELPLDWLETHYPGALHRMHLGQFLGYTDETLVNTVFYPEITQESEVTLPSNVDFSC